MKVNSKLRVERLSTFDEFVSLEREWNAISGDPVKTVFLKHFWLSQWWKTYGDAYVLWTLTVRHENRLLGILPLVYSRKKFGVRFLTIMGTGEITPNHLDLIADSFSQMDVAHSIAAYLQETSLDWDVLELDKTVSDSPAMEALNRYFSLHGFIVDRKVSAKCLYIELPKSFDEYLKSRSHNFRRRLHKAKRNLSRDFPNMAFKMASTENELQKAMSTLIRLHQIRWTSKGYPGSFSNDGFNGFHRAVALYALRHDFLRLYYIELDEEIVAVRYAYQVSDTLQGYLGGFDDRWADYSLGVLLTSHVVEHLILQGVCFYDFLEGEESYKRDWATQTRDNVRLRFFSSSVRGRLIHNSLIVFETLIDWGTRFVPVWIRRPLWQMILRRNTA